MATASRGSSCSVAGRAVKLPRNTDLDVAVILAGDVDRYGEKLAFADLAYDAIVETGIDAEPRPRRRTDAVTVSPAYDLPKLARHPFPR